MLLITGEYSTGMIRSSLTVVPHRLPMLWGKLAVFAGVVFLTMLVASVTAFFVGQALLEREQHGRRPCPTPARCVRSSARRCT